MPAGRKIAASPSAGGAYSKIPMRQAVYILSGL